jgi:mono/diheme cytochrome c family protein
MMAVPWDSIAAMRAAAFLATIAVGLPVALAGCGASDDPKNDNLVAGKVAFVKNCGSCHVLARAGTKGTTGPDLDQAFQQSLKEGFGRDAVRGLVKHQVEFPNSNGVMPADLVKGEAVTDVAAYVAASVDEPGKDTGVLADAVKPAGAGKPAVAKNGVLPLEADPNGQLAYTAKTATAPAGKLTIAFTNTSGTQHDVAIQPGTNGAVIGKTPVIPKGKAQFSATLKPGKYTFFCTVPGHRVAGMLGTLTVK